MSSSTFNTPRAPQPIGPYNQGHWAGSLFFVSGQIALTPGLDGLQGENTAQQAEVALTNLSHILQDAGLGLQDIVKITVFVLDMAEYTAFNEVYARFFEKPTAPARELVQVGALPAGARVEISAIAYKNSHNE